MARKAQSQKQRQKQTLTNVIKIALDGRRKSKRRSRRTYTQPQQPVAQQALGQLLVSNQPQRLGYSLLERQLQDEKMRNLERLLKSTEDRIRSTGEKLASVNPIAQPTFSDGSMGGKPTEELLSPPPKTPRKRVLFEPEDLPEPPEPLGGEALLPEPTVGEMRRFLKDNIKSVTKPDWIEGRLSKAKIDDQRDDELIRQLYRETFPVVEGMRMEGSARKSRKSKRKK